MSKTPSLSVFFPAYNEEKNIGKTVEKALKILPSLASNYEIIVVNDGSTDSTKAVVEKITEKDPQVKIVSHPKNLGYGAALRTGFSTASNPLIAYIDADGQYEIGEISKFLEKINKADLVIGQRKKRAEGSIREINERVLSFLVRFFYGVKIADVDCGFKMISAEALKKISPLSATFATISTEIIAKAAKNNLKIAKVSVTHLPRIAGKQTGSTPAVIAKSAIEFFKLWWKLKG